MITPGQPASRPADRERPVAVIGAGTMGQGIAQVFAASGSHVTLIDVSQDATDRGFAAIDSALQRSVDRNRLEADERKRTLGRLTTATSMEGAEDAGLVIEAVFEDLDAKLRVFEALTGIVSPETLVVSNTSSLSITRLAAATTFPERVAGLHFFNPVPVLPLVEIVRGLATSDATVERLRAVATEIGKTGVVVRDSPGFVVNRILIPMINEAITCLDHGVAGRDDIDTTMRLGANHPMGPLQLADLIGLDVCLDIMATLHRDLGEDRYRPSPLLRTMVSARRLGRKTGRGFYDYAAH